MYRIAENFARGKISPISPVGSSCKTLPLMKAVFCQMNHDSANILASFVTPLQVH